MRISNPRTLAGDRPLATREYVEVSVSNLSSELYIHISNETKQLSSYVQKVSGDLMDTIDTVSGYLSSTIDTTSTFLHNEVKTTSTFLQGEVNYLSGAINTNLNKVSGWLTNDGNHSLGDYGYAWLTETGKIDPSLMPPLSLTNVITINQFDILSEISQYNGEGTLPGGATVEAFDSFINHINRQTGTVTGTVSGNDEFGVLEYWLRLPMPPPGPSGQFAHPVQMGDMLLVTYSLNDIQPDLEYTDYTDYIKTWRPAIISSIVDSDTFTTKKTTGGDSWKEFIASWYSINNNYVGQYIVVRGNTHNGLQDIYNGSDVDGTITGSIFDNNNTIDGEPYPTSPLPQIQKLTMPDGTIRSICGISPTDSNGNVRLQLKDIYVTENNAIFGKEKADYIVSIKPEETFDSYNGLSGTARNHFTIHDVSYARFDELKEFWKEFDNTRSVLTAYDEALSGVLSAEIIRSTEYDKALSGILSDEIDRSTAYDKALSGVLSTEIIRSEKYDDLLSTTFGSAISGAAPTGIYEDIITESVFDQLRRIYNDMTIDRRQQEIIYSKTEFLHNILNNKAAGIQTIEFEWKIGQPAATTSATVQINKKDTTLYVHALQTDPYYNYTLNTSPASQPVHFKFNNATIYNSDIYFDRLVGGFYNSSTQDVYGGIKVGGLEYKFEENGDLDYSSETTNKVYSVSITSPLITNDYQIVAAYVKMPKLELDTSSGKYIAVKDSERKDCIRRLLAFSHP